MTKRPDTELTNADSGPAITFRGKDSEATFDLREIVRGPIYTAANTLQKRTLREWLNARQAEVNKSPPATGRSSKRSSKS